ncbi:HAD family hydrolase [Candidatus Latescibacterota bacterium]
MHDPQAALKQLKPCHDFLIAIDSDGCVFDTMEIKQKECFIPTTIKLWNLQPISKYVRTASEFVNLYSQWRGANRFPALVKVFELLAEWPDVRKRNVTIPDVRPLREWIENESMLGNPALQAEVEKTGDPVLSQTLRWSNAVNAAVEDMVSFLPPFPFVLKILEETSQWADIIVCSGTPGDALTREWAENGIDTFPLVIAGQEMGKKAEHLALVKEKYPEGGILMIGDAPGDLKAAKDNNLLFYPVNPGHEEDSWKLFHEKIADIFRRGCYNAKYEKELIYEFETLLPAEPPWKK